jgi:hypothetical protein
MLATLHFTALHYGKDVLGQRNNISCINNLTNAEEK